MGNTLNFKIENREDRKTRQIMKLERKVKWKSALIDQLWRGGNVTGNVCIEIEDVNNVSFNYCTIQSEQRASIKCSEV